MNRKGAFEIFAILASIAILVLFLVGLFIGARLIGAKDALKVKQSMEDVKTSGSALALFYSPSPSTKYLAVQIAEGDNKQVKTALDSIYGEKNHGYAVYLDGEKISEEISNIKDFEEKKMTADVVVAGKKGLSKIKFEVALNG